MALEIKVIPTLTGDAARRFIEAAETAEREAAQREPVDMSRQYEEMRAILKKANMI